MYINVNRAHMERICDLIRVSLSNLPIKHTPKGIDPDSYSIEMELKFRMASTNDELTSRQKLTDMIENGSSLTYEDGYYKAGIDCYLFICTSKLRNATVLDLQINTFLMKIVQDKLFVPDMTIGLILSLQETVATLKITSGLYCMLTRGSKVTQEEFVRLLAVRSQIGKTIKLKGLPEWRSRGLPIQVFLGPCIASKHNDDPCASQFANVEGSRSIRVKLLADTVDKWNVPVYIHAPYNFNICIPKIRLDGILDDLRDSKPIKARGVVIHVGKNTSAEIPIHVAIGRMRDNVMKLLVYATPECPLLVETPAGQGSEVLTDADHLISFYNSFDDKDKARMGICVDTCHVFAVGYSPLEYIKYVNSALPGVIRLIHYNDSLNPRGSCVDRHFPVGGGFAKIKHAADSGELPACTVAGELGHIGVRRLRKLAEWCLERKIPMVTE